MSYRLHFYSTTKSEYNGVLDLFKKIKNDINDSGFDTYSDYVKKYFKFIDELNDETKFDEKNKIENSVCNFWVIPENELLNIIQHHFNITKEYYNELMEDVEKGNNKKFYSYMHFKIGTFDTINHYLDLDKNKKDILSKSGRYEYDIFNLVLLYKTFDFENNVLVCAGW